jgi:cellobiose phosphorylase
VRASADGLTVDPCLPEAWNALELNLKFRDQPVRIQIQHDSLIVHASAAVPVSVDGRLGRHFERQEGLWKEVGG